MDLANCPERGADWWRRQIWKQAVTAGESPSRVLGKGPGTGRKYLLPGEQGGRVSYRRLPRGWFASALSGRAVRVPDGFVCKSSESSASLDPAPQKSGFTGFCGFPQNAASWVTVLHEQKGLLQHLTATYRKRLGGRKERQDEKTSNLRSWGASFSPLKLTHPCGSKAVKVFTAFPPRSVIPLSQIHFLKTYLFFMQPFIQGSSEN